MSTTNDLAKSADCQYKITPEEMWNLMKNDDSSFGIKGYEVPRKYYRGDEKKKYEERQKILENPKPVWPPPDWPKDKKDGDKQVPPVRRNFIDDVVKLANSFNDPAKSQELYEKYKDKIFGKPPSKISQIDRRQKFLEHEENEKKRKEGLPKIQEWKAAACEAAEASRKKDESEKKTPIQIMLEKYNGKPSWPRCDRVTIVGKFIFLIFIL